MDVQNMFASPFLLQLLVYEIPLQLPSSATTIIKCLRALLQANAISHPSPALKVRGMVSFFHFHLFISLFPVLAKKRPFFIFSGDWFQINYFWRLDFPSQLISNTVNALRYVLTTTCISAL